MPVFDDDSVVGMVLRSDILRRAAADEFEPTMADIMRPITSVLSLDRCGHEGDARERVQILTVEEEFGTIIGLVTMEDVMETLLVEIVDEADIEGIEDGAVREDIARTRHDEKKEEE